MLPVNRIGATRGPNGTTLDDLLAALQANTAAVNALAEGQVAQAGALAAILTGINAIAAAQAGLSAQLGALALSTGSPADTTCNLSQLELLCAIATQLGLETAPADIPPPPATCPGYPESPTAWLYVADWEPIYSESTFIGQWSAIFSTPLNPPSLYIQQKLLYDTTNVQTIRTTADKPLCVSWDKPDPLYSISWDVQNVSDDSIYTLASVVSTYTDTGIGSRSDLPLPIGKYVLIRAYRAGGFDVDAKPQAQIWIQEGELS